MAAIDKKVERNKMGKIEVIEWSAIDEFGDREFMGTFLYDEQTCSRIVRKGGLIEWYGILHTSVEDITALFGRD